MVQRNSDIKREVERLTKEIINNAKDKAKNIILKAKERSNEILNEVKVEILEEIKDIYTIAKEKAREKSDKIIFQTMLNHHKELIIKKEDIIQKVIESLKKNLKKSLSSKKYSIFLKNKIIESINYLEEPEVILILNNDDKKAIDLEYIKTRVNVEDINIKLSKESLSDDNIGGFVLKSPENRITINNTLNEIISREEDRIRSYITKELFTKEGLKDSY
ncbi:MAG: hypothetical protein GF329_17600 [Candidatus Lokiarchaeota archaeon]|nr:hypothetical protein [Candidatus Lokiarchaeota archaeon]